MRLAFITGISGFLGQHLASALRVRGIEVAGLTRNVAAAESIEGSISGDITDRAFVLDLVHRIRPDVVFHLAANKSRTGGIEDFRRGIEDNVVGTLNLAEACIDKSYVKRFVTLGTCEEYGHSPIPFIENMRESPINAYSFSKTSVTHLLQTLHRAHNLPIVVLRPSLAYGPGQGTDMFLPALIQSLLKGESFAMSGGQQTRDYIYVDDLIEAVVLAAILPEAIGKVINIGSGAPLVLRDLALLVEQLIGGKAAEGIDFGKKAYRPNEIMDYVARYEEAKIALGWSPHTSLKDGLRLTIAYYLQSSFAGPRVN